MTSAPDFNASCGHYAPPGARFCPECGSTIAASSGPDPAKLSTVSSDSSDRPEPPRWPWEVAADDELHAVRSDPTIVPPPFATQPGPHNTGPLPKGPTEPPRSRRGRLLLMIIGAVAVVVIVAATLVVLNRHPGNSSADARATTGATHKPTPKATPSPTLAQLRASKEGQAAIALAKLLSQASSEFASVPTATADVRACGSKVEAAKNTLYDDASGSRKLLSSLGPLWKDHNALPTAVLQDITNTWEASDDEYIDLARWADAAQHGGCASKTVDSNADLRASASPTKKATSDAQAFVRLWTPIADKYDLPVYTYSQL